MEPHPPEILPFSSAEMIHEGMYDELVHVNLLASELCTMTCCLPQKGAGSKMSRTEGEKTANSGVVVSFLLKDFKMR